MPYVRVWVHLVWSTKNREPVLGEEMRAGLFDHIRVNAREKGIYLDTIGGYVDHVHALISLGSDQTIAMVARLIKGESSHWINQNSMTRGKFEWQEEYFAVSVSESVLGKVKEYIKGQEEHHRRRSFAEEFQEFIERYGFAGEGLKSA